MNIAKTAGVGPVISCHLYGGIACSYYYVIYNLNTYIIIKGYIYMYMWFIQIYLAHLFKMRELNKFLNRKKKEQYLQNHLYVLNT